MNETLEKLKNYFATGETKSLKFRTEQLKKLKKSYLKFEPDIIYALKSDLKKPLHEAYSMEFYPVLKEIDNAIFNLKKWAKPEKVHIESRLKPNEGVILKEPLGVALIISAFNYPFQLAFSPLVGAIAAGNCAIVKPASASHASSEIIQAIIKDAFPENYITTSLEHSLIEEKFDCIFFTGSTKTGAKVAEAAGKNLVPVILELGGKSPAIVSKNADIEAAAKKIAWGKFVNAGQTCIAPDYCLVQQDIAEDFIAEIKKTIKMFFGPIPQHSNDFGRITSEKAFHRLKNLINYDNLILGGSTDECGLYIEPTLVSADFEDKIMEEEIFGPILPVITFENLDSVEEKLKTLEKPLALYLFTRDKKEAEKIMTGLSFGGGAINETLIHTGSINLPFGGVGKSGMGRYHGKYTFDAFSHTKSVLYNIHKKSYYRNLPPYDFSDVKSLKH